ncbi:MAG: 4-hydroxy-tetrahydrodipicolinate synthase [Clostridiales bacterium]|jgi:4-hydroxy-tetrahydrodipicolinate synthase|nr:4-hydroxy-tetrahydrodipicolinate synthase [Clostridiales bacterium]
MSHQPLFKGCATALITPFTSDGIDYAALDALIDFQIAGGVDALVVLGTTGEPSTMTAQEKRDVISFSIKKVNRRVPVIVGSGSNSTDAAIKNSVLAEKLGADGLLVVTPYYNKCTQNGLVAHFHSIADNVGIPLILYNVPGRTGLNMSPQTAAKACEHKNVSAIKEASGNIEQISEISRLLRGKAYIYSGDDAIVVPVVSVGGIGVISVAGNVAPKYFSDMTRLALGGNLDRARDMQLDALPFVKALFSEVSPIPIKAASKLMGLSNGIVRPPLCDIEEANLANLKKTMSQLGILI